MAVTLSRPPDLFANAIRFSTVYFDICLPSKATCQNVFKTSNGFNVAIQVDPIWILADKLFEQCMIVG